MKTRIAVAAVSSAVVVPVCLLVAFLWAKVPWDTLPIAGYVALALFSAMIGSLAVSQDTPVE